MSSFVTNTTHGLAFKMWSLEKEGISAGLRKVKYYVL